MSEPTENSSTTEPDSSEEELLWREMFEALAEYETPLPVVEFDFY